MMNHSIWEFNQNKDRIFIGISYSFIAALVIPIYISIIHALRTKNEFKDNVSYKLINLLNVCDLFQSVNHVFSGFFIVFPILAVKIDPFIRIIGHTANTLWTASYVIIAVLTLTRLAVTFFHFKPNEWTWWMKVLLILGGIYIFIIWIIGCITLNFKLNGVAWEYDIDAPFVDILSPLELYFCLPVMVLSFTSYLLILGNIFKKKRQTKNASFRSEIPILVQATVLTSYMAVLMILWHNAEYVFELTDINVSFLNLCWIMFAHLNAFLLIVTNRTIRRQLLSTFYGSSKISQKKSVVTSSTAALRRPSTIVS